MSEFVRKAMMGYKEVPGGYEDQECTHVILTKQEYADQLKEVNQARIEAQSTKYNANREIQEMRREAQIQVEFHCPFSGAFQTRTGGFILCKSRERETPMPPGTPQQ